MIKIYEDDNFKKDILVEIASEVYRYKKQRQGATFSIAKISKNFNLEKSDLEKKLIESSIVENNKWSSFINKKMPIKIISNKGDLHSEVIFDVGNKVAINEDKKQKNILGFNVESSVERDILEVFNYWYKIFPSKRKINEKRRGYILKLLKKNYKVESLKKAIDTVNFRIECINKKGEKRHNDIDNIFRPSNIDNNINKYEYWQKKYSVKKHKNTNIILSKNKTKDLRPTEISKIIKVFTKQTKHGILEMKCPTGFGKTYSAIVFMQDFIRNDKSKKIVVFVSRQKTNLEEPLKDLESRLTEEEKKKVFRVRAEDDMYKFINENENYFLSLASKLDESVFKETSKKIKIISKKYKQYEKQPEDLKEICKKDLGGIKSNIVKGLKKDTYLNGLTKEEKNIVHSFFPLNKIEEGGCKVVATTINKANVASHKIVFDSNGNANKKSDILFKLKVGGDRQNRSNDIFIIDESQNFTSTLNNTIVENAIEFDIIELINSLADRYQEEPKYPDNLTKRLQISGLDKKIRELHLNYKLHNGTLFLGGEKDIYKYNYLVDEGKVIPLKNASKLYYKVSDNDEPNEVYFSNENKGDEPFNIFVEKAQKLILDFSKRVESSYRVFLKELEESGKISSIRNPKDNFIIKMHLGHTDFKWYIHNILENFAPNQKEEKVFNDLYEDLKNKNYILTLKSGDLNSIDLKFLIGERDANNELLTLAKNNKVIFLSGTADANTVIGNNHIKFLKDELLKNSDKYVYRELKKEEQESIFKEFSKRNPFINSIKRNISCYEVDNSKEDSWLENFNYVTEKLRLSNETTRRFHIEVDGLEKSYDKSRLMSYFRVVTDFLLNNNNQIMLSCHSKFNYDGFFQDNKNDSSLKSCISFLVKSSPLINEEKIHIKSFNSIGYREYIEKETYYLGFGEKYIFTGTTVAVGQGANISVKIRSREEALEMNYVSTKEGLSDNINACIDTLFIEKPTHLIGLPDREKVGDTKYKLGYLMKINLLSSGSLDFNEKDKAGLLKKIDNRDNNPLNNFYVKQKDYNNNIDAIVKQIVGRIPRSDVFKKEIQIFLDKSCLESVSKTKQKNIDFNTLEYKEVYQYASNFIKDNMLKSRNKFNLEIKKLNDEFETLQREKIDSIQKQKKLKDNKEDLEKAIIRRDKFISSALNSIGGKKEVPFGLSKFYKSFDKERYFFKEKNGNISNITTEYQNGLKYFDYNLLNAKLFCEITGANPNQFPELSYEFDPHTLPVPSLARYLLGFRAEKYAKIIFKKYGFVVLKPNPIIEEDADFVIETDFGRFAIDIKNSESKDYDKNRSLKNKINRVYNYMQDCKYIVVDLWCEGESEEKLISSEVSRFNGLIDKKNKKENFVEFELFLKKVANLRGKK